MFAVTLVEINRATKLVGRVGRNLRRIVQYETGVKHGYRYLSSYLVFIRIVWNKSSGSNQSGLVPVKDRNGQQLVVRKELKRDGQNILGMC